VTATKTTTADSHRGRGAGGVSIGIETTRSYQAEDVPSGSQRSVERVLKTLLDRNDIVRIWMTPVEEKDRIWEHRGVLNTLPKIDALFEASEETVSEDTTEGSLQFAA